MSEDKIYLGYRAWGLHGQHELDIAVLKDFSVLNPIRVPKPWNGSTKTYDIKGIKVEVSNESSRKNPHYIVKVPRDAVLAIYSETATSGNFRADVSAIDPSVASAEVIEREEKRLLNQTSNKKIYGVFKVRLVKLVLKDGTEKEVPVSEDYIRSETELTGKPKVVIEKQEKSLVIYGDTYYVKDALKSLGAKWEPFDKIWIVNNAELDKVVKALEANAEVVVK